MDIRHAVGVKVGVPVEKLADILMYRGSPHFSERERTALEFCERITRDELEVSDDCFMRLREHFAAAEIVAPRGGHRAAGAWARAHGTVPWFAWRQATTPPAKVETSM